MGDHIAVFSKGRPEQVGTPEEIYNEPANRFVADFIGDINFVDAVKSAEGEITVEGVPFRVKQDISALPIGAEVSAAIRPERITLTAPRETALTGTVETLMFMGADVRCEVRLTDGTTLLVRLSPPYDTAVLHEGATVSVEVEAEHMRVVER